MDEQLQTIEPVQVPVEVVTLTDAQTLFDGYSSGVESGFASIEQELMQLNGRLATQADEGSSGVVLLDDAQWADINAHMDYVQRSSSVSLFFSLLTLCVVSAVLGTRLWSTISQGWRHG